MDEQVIYYCEGCRIARVDDEECPECGKTMLDVGFITNVTPNDS